MLLAVITSVILSNASVFLILYVMGLRQAQKQKDMYLRAFENAINNDLNAKFEHDLASMDTYNGRGNFQ